MLLILAVAPGLRGKETETSPHYVGWIEEIKSPAFLKTGANSKPVTLDQKRDRFRLLQDGEVVRCGPGGALKLQIGGKFKEIESSADWYTIHRTPSTNPDILGAIESYGHIVGRDRQISSIFSPAQRSRVRAQWLEFRWLPDSTVKNVSLLLLDSARREIWREGSIDPAIGHFTSESARHVLDKLKDQNPQREYFFVIASGQHSLVESRFSLLSTAEEQALDRELRKWDTRHPTFLTYIMRAYWFDHYGLCAETAQEYEAALLAAPESRSMVAATIRAENCTGNIERIKELETHLSSLESDNGSK